MKISRILIAVSLTLIILVAQFSVAFAAPASKTSPLTGIVHSICLETDVNNAVTSVLVTILGENDTCSTVRINLETALTLGLITTDENGMPFINPTALGLSVQIDPKTVIADDEVHQHPVGAALATFFTEVTDYKTLMEAHEKGFGFGIIAQALWLTKKLGGDSEDFLAILDAKKTEDFSAFALEDGTTPTNWGQLRKAILDGNKKSSLGIVVIKKDKDGVNHGNGNGGGNGNGNNNSGGNGINNNNGNGNGNK